MTIQNSTMWATRPLGVFEIGDRVIRNERQGTITNVYSSTPTHIGDTVTQYAVRWDDVEYTESGYMAVGLEREPLSVGGLLAN